MTSHLFSQASAFTCVADPYAEDEFVRSTYAPVSGADGAAETFAAFVEARRLLPFLIEALAETRRRQGADAPLPVVDCGVYMGLFSIAAHLAAAARDVAVAIRAHEANPLLVEPIRRNFATYGVEGEVLAGGVAGAAGRLTFAFPKGRMVGGSLSKRDGDPDDIVSVDCDVRPLAEILPAEPAPGLVKIDIEGSEVAAFASIMDAPAKLDNVFIVEFAPWQGRRAMPGGQTYAAWLAERHHIFDVVNWAYCPEVTPIDGPEALDGILEGKTRKHNTDLVLIPRSLPGIADGFRAAFVRDAS